MKVKNRVTDPITLQLLVMSLRKRNAIVAACDRELRYTHLFNPHPRFDAESAMDKRDDELAPPEDVAELLALKREVLETGRALERRVHVMVGETTRTYDITADPIHDEDGRVAGVATAALDVTPSADVQTLLEKLSRRLDSQSRGVTERWHQELTHRLNLRPQSIFPGDDLLDGVPRVVEWLSHSVLHGAALDASEAESLRDIASHWRRGGYSIEESLIHLRLLEDLLHDALADAVEELGGGLNPAAGVEAARRLARGLDMVRVVLVATYRDAEEDRFTEFGGTLAHEIRGHLSAALAGLQLLEMLDSESEGSDERRSRVLERTEHALGQAGRVVDSVRALSRAAVEGEETWTYRPLGRVVADVVAEQDPDEGVSLEVAGDLPPVTVPAEPVQVILHNLVDNAIKYSNPAAGRCWVRISAERDRGDGHLVVHVGDNGLGIPESEQERIFLRFRRGKAATGDGFGLGLAIVREAARKFGGRILLESEPRRGSTFSVTIPAERLDG